MSILRIQATLREELHDAALELHAQLDNPPPGLEPLLHQLSETLDWSAEASDRVGRLLHELEACPGIDLVEPPLLDGDDLDLSLRVELPAAFMDRRMARRVGGLLLGLVAELTELTYADVSLRLGRRRADFDEVQRELIHRAAHRGVFLQPTIAFGEDEPTDNDDGRWPCGDGDDEEDDSFAAYDDAGQPLDWDEGDAPSEEDSFDEADASCDGFPDGGFGTRVDAPTMARPSRSEFTEEERFFLEAAELCWPVGAEQLRLALRRLRFRFHPDRDPSARGGHRLFVRVTEGHQQLRQRLEGGVVS